nr:hypothetical protein [Tanacetum cinerariifolium]
MKTKRKLVPKSYPFTEDSDVVPSDAGHRVYDGNSTFSPKKQCLDGPSRISSPPIMFRTHISGSLLQCWINVMHYQIL